LLSLAKTREIGREAGESRKCLVGMKLLGSIEKHFFCLLVVGVGHAAFNRTNGLAGLVVEEPNTLTAAGRIDDVFAVTLADCVIGTLGLTSSAVDAFVGNMGSHVAPFKGTVEARAHGPAEKL
jgi:hypothetical protein